MVLKKRFRKVWFWFMLGVVAGVSRMTIAATLTIDSEQLNVYAGPGRTYDVIETVKRNEKFEILEQQEGWFRISVDGRLGWVPGKGVATVAEKTLAELLTLADRYFERQQFTTPPDANAFDLYQEVLRRAPENSHARQKIEQMARLYKTWAENAEQRGDSEKARIFYQRYLFLVPTDQDVKNDLTATHQPMASSGSPVQSIRLRTDPTAISAEALRQMVQKYHFNHPADWSKYGFSASLTGTFQHDFEVITTQGVKVVLDYATDLMWQQVGSDTPMPWREAQHVVLNLNAARYAGYADWRLPTIEELASLLTAQKSRKNLYLAPEFGATLLWCWSADPVASSAEMAWYISFSSGGIQPHEMLNSAYVLAVRSMRSVK